MFSSFLPPTKSWASHHPSPGRTLVRHPRDACRRCSLFVQTPHRHHERAACCRRRRERGFLVAADPIPSVHCTRSLARARRGHSMDNKGYYIDHVRACGLPAGKPVVSRSQNVGMHVAAGQERARSTPLYALSIARRTSCARFLASLALSYRARPPAHQLPASRRFHQPCACVYRPKEEINGHRTGL